MNSHDIFDTNVTLFRKRVISRRLYDIRNIRDKSHTFNINADMSYFPVYPGTAGIKKLYGNLGGYEYYGVELLGMAKDITPQISFVNPNPDPYFDTENILSAFANARVYQDYAGYMDDTLKLIDNRLIGANSDVLVKQWKSEINSEQAVVVSDRYMVWQIGLNHIYGGFDPDRIKRLKVILFSKKCYGKNPYMFLDLGRLADGWMDLSYDADAADMQECEVATAKDYVFGYGNRVVIQSTLDGLGHENVCDSNHIFNVSGLHARLVTD